MPFYDGVNRINSHCSDAPTIFQSLPPGCTHEFPFAAGNMAAYFLEPTRFLRWNQLWDFSEDFPCEITDRPHLPRELFAGPRMH